MSQVAAVIVDTYANQQLARLAIEKTVQTGLVDRVYTFSAAPIYPGENFYRINPIHSAAAYSHVLLNLVPFCVDADAVLVIQWDGMPGNVAAWDDAFRRYDYIGAPWGHCDRAVAVGNGGFSWRSRRLLETLADLRIRCDPALPESDAEDVVICRHYRAEIEAHGCSFAPFETGQRFSMENEGEGAPPSFGFHGMFNLPLYVPEADLLGKAAELCERTGRDFFLINYLLACLRRNYHGAYQEAVGVLAQQTRGAQIAQALAQLGRSLPGLSATAGPT